MTELQEGKDAFKKFLLQFAEVPDEDLDSLFSKIEVVSFGRKEIMTREGQVEKYLYFALDGIQRGYHLKNGREYTVAFTYHPSFSGIPESLLSKAPSTYYLETITPSILLRLPYQHMEELADSKRSIERLLRRIYERFILGLFERNFELLSASMEDRFSIFMKRSGHLINKIPHKYIASYLGIDPTNFSKLMNQKKVL
jgi:CRP-like cAMP-binding protein